jgi:peptidase C13-like protein
MSPRLVLSWYFVAVLMLACGPALGAGPEPGRWQAVLVAGDNAQPVFDNAVEALARWLADRGTPAADIHRFSASQPPRDPAVEPASADRILQRIASLRPLPGERCLIFVTSHGQRGEGIWLAQSEEYLRPARLAQALSVGCSQVPSVVILSACYSGAFVAGPMRAPNRIILSAARADRPSFGCQADRTYTVFDECLLAALPRASTWRAVNEASLGCVRRRERQLGVLPSQPQASFGAAVRDLAVR